MSECCEDREFEDWIDDCGGRVCTLRKIIWSEWLGQDACADCPFVCDEFDYEEREGEQ